MQVLGTPGLTQQDMQEHAQLIRAVLIALTLIRVIRGCSYCLNTKSFPVHAAQGPASTKTSIIYTHLVVHWTQKLYLEVEEV